MDMMVHRTGRTACALQDAMRLSNERFAKHLGIGVRNRLVVSYQVSGPANPAPAMGRLLSCWPIVGTASQSVVLCAAHSQQPAPMPPSRDHKIEAIPPSPTAIIESAHETSPSDIVQWRRLN